MTIEKYNGYQIEIDYDQFGTDPASYGNYSIVTYNRGGYASNSKITDVDLSEHYDDETGELTPEMSEEVKTGRAWPISYSEHGSCRYDLAADATKPDGWIIFEPEYATNATGLDALRAMAKSDLEEYTKWANGEVYFAQVRDPYGDLVADDGEGMGDIIGYEWALQFGQQVVDSDGINYATKAKNARELHR
jgi:hypothetical protein